MNCKKNKKSSIPMHKVKLIFIQQNMTYHISTRSPVSHMCTTYAHACSCMYKHAHTHTHTHTHTHAHTHVHTHKHS